MSRYSKDDLDRYFDYGVFVPKRMVYMGSLFEEEDGSESGTDFSMAEKIIKSITYLNSISEKPITIIMNNIGGEWSHGMAIFDTIKSSKCYITIVAVGNCSSMASIIIQAADLRVISQNCEFVIHDGSTNLSGHAKNVEVWAKRSEMDRLTMYNIYREKMKIKNPKITTSQIEKLCTIDKIYTAEEVVKIGLADEVLDDIMKYIKE